MQAICMKPMRINLSHLVFECNIQTVVWRQTVIAADFLTGVYHWSVDNYGDGSTPIVGSQIAAFQGHHQKPWTITEREFCNNVYKVRSPLLPSTACVTHGVLGYWNIIRHPDFHADAFLRSLNAKSRSVLLSISKLAVSLHHSARLQSCLVFPSQGHG